MSDRVSDNGRLLSRWERLAAADRAAIMQALPDERRLQLEHLLEESGRGGKADRQFAGYSPWLATLVEASTVTGNTAGDQADGLREPVKQALREAHVRLLQDGLTSTMNPSGLSQLRDRLVTWIARA